MTSVQSSLRVALLGNPNCGKTALFNLLTGSRQKVANYAGVTVERKEGLFETTSGIPIEALLVASATQARNLPTTKRHAGAWNSGAWRNS